MNHWCRSDLICLSCTRDGPSTSTKRKSHGTVSNPRHDMRRQQGLSLAAEQPPVGVAYADVTAARLAESQPPPGLISTAPFTVDASCAIVSS
jgi:hypothetical protein